MIDVSSGAAAIDASSGAPGLAPEAPKDETEDEERMRKIQDKYAAPVLELYGAGH